MESFTASLFEKEENRKIKIETSKEEIKFEVQEEIKYLINKKIK